MLLIVQSQTPDRLHVIQGKGCQQETHVGDLIGHLVLAEDITRDDAGLPGLGDICDTLGQNGITIVNPAISGEKADETL